MEMSTGGESMETGLHLQLTLTRQLTLLAAVHVLGRVAVLLALVKVDGVNNGLRVLSSIVQSDGRVLKYELPLVRHSLLREKKSKQAVKVISSLALVLDQSYWHRLSTRTRLSKVIKASLVL